MDTTISMAIELNDEHLCQVTSEPQPPVDTIPSEPIKGKRSAGSLICCVVFAWVQTCLTIGVVFLLVLVLLEGIPALTGNSITNQTTALVSRAPQSTPAKKTVRFSTPTGTSSSTSSSATTTTNLATIPLETVTPTTIPAITTQPPNPQLVHLVRSLLNEAGIDAIELKKINFVSETMELEDWLLAQTLLKEANDSRAEDTTIKAKELYLLALKILLKMGLNKGTEIDWYHTTAGAEKIMNNHLILLSEHLMNEVGIGILKDMLILDSIDASETQVILEAWLLIQSLLQEVYKSGNDQGVIRTRKFLLALKMKTNLNNATRLEPNGTQPGGSSTQAVFQALEEIGFGLELLDLENTEVLSTRAQLEAWMLAQALLPKINKSANEQEVMKNLKKLFALMIKDGLQIGKEGASDVHLIAYRLINDYGYSKNIFMRMDFMSNAKRQVQWEKLLLADSLLKEANGSDENKINKHRKLLLGIKLLAEKIDN